MINKIRLFGTSKQINIETAMKTSVGTTPHSPYATIFLFGADEYFR